MVGFAQLPKFLGTYNLMKIAALFRAEGPCLPEFLEPQKFSLVKLFCPILLIKFYFISTNLKLTQIFSTLPQNPPQIGCSAPNMRPSRSSPNFLSLSHLLPKPTQSHTLSSKSQKFCRFRTS